MLIVGAGIGGLTTAIALRQAGFPVEVFERAPKLKEAGAGIALSANATRVLKHLGLLERIVENATVLEATVAYDGRGQTLLRMPLNHLADVPSVSLHRADLQQALYSALPPDSVHLGEEFLQVEQTRERVTAHFANGRALSGEILIGADGLRSKLRSQLLGEGEPVYRGYQCWRGVCAHPGRQLLTETFGRGIRVGIVPIGPRGTAWWCTADEPERSHNEPEDAKSKLRHWLGSWHSPIPELIAATVEEAIIKTPICDRPPTKRWSQGRCTLLGDAAHPTTPNMGQGDAMAIEDAAVLTRCLLEHSDPAAALAAYERVRRRRTASVMRMSRCYGIVGQWSNPGAVWLRNALFRLTPAKAAARMYASFVCHDLF